jgi:ATP-dependent Clp endopeptidase proteolytic subunit ClpP
MKKSWYNFTENGSEAEISILDEIGGFGITVQELKEELDRAKNASHIRLLINSPGGDVIEGMAVYNLLASIREKVSVEVVGLAASIASIIALAGKEKPVIHEGAFFMIHDPFAVSWGTADALRRDAAVLDKMTDSLVKIYQDASGLPEDEIREMMEVETWLSAEEAVSKGFASEVKQQGIKAAACASLRKYGFAHVPECLQKSIVSIREFEAFLRDEGGFSCHESKLIASHGFTAFHRDDEELEEIAEALKSNIRLMEK